MLCKYRTEQNTKENATATVRCVAAIENACTTKTERELFIDRYCMLESYQLLEVSVSTVKRLPNGASY